MPLVIRSERKSDENAIEGITHQAFASHPHSSHAEHLIIRALREANVLTISLVAEQSNEVVGHIAFSPVTISDGTSGWFGLGPVSVLPSVQKRGIGRALIEHGLSQLRELGADGCVLLGEPSFYKRFGFSNSPGLYATRHSPRVLLGTFLRLRLSARQS
ncbi:GNAT family N-acetyltransferase [Methylomonas sp. MK1]|uniref:GNAT family N-acetyltransferase n=1 Tax=Methylomonas sp. MK1 TaxID=1131552 RepID=UPI001F3388B4|nr:N-acetyltransferase [Methylomonas sp. MK1]